jgi:hypothetical protein
MADHDAWGEADQPSPVVPPRAVGVLLVAVVAAASAPFPPARFATVVLGVVATVLGVAFARKPGSYGRVRWVAGISVAIGILSLVVGVTWVAMGVVTSSAFGGF